MRRLVFFSLLLALPLVLSAQEKVSVHESPFNIWANASAPIPSEVSNETQARALSRDAAIMMAQDALLHHVLQKKTSSGRPLSVAEVPSLELQQKIRETIKGAQVSKTQWLRKECRVTLEISKSRIRPFLKRN